MYVYVYVYTIQKIGFINNSVDEMVCGGVRPLQTSPSAHFTSCPGDRVQEVTA